MGKNVLDDGRGRDGHFVNNDHLAPFRVEGEAIDPLKLILARKSKSQERKASSAYAKRW